MKKYVFRPFINFFKESRGGASVEIMAYLSFMVPVIFGIIIMQKELYSNQMRMENAVRYAMNYIIQYADKGTATVKKEAEEKTIAVMKELAKRENVKDFNADKMKITIKEPTTFWGGYYTVSVNYEYRLPPAVRFIREYADLGASLSFIAGNQPLFKPDMKLNFDFSPIFKK